MDRGPGPMTNPLSADPERREGCGRYALPEDPLRDRGEAR